MGEERDVATYHLHCLKSCSFSKLTDGGNSIFTRKLYPLHPSLPRLQQGPTLKNTEMSYLKVDEHSIWATKIKSVKVAAFRSSESQQNQEPKTNLKMEYCLTLH